MLPTHLARHVVAVLLRVQILLIDLLDGASLLGLPVDGQVGRAVVALAHLLAQLVPVHLYCPS